MNPGSRFTGGFVRAAHRSVSGNRNARSGDGSTGGRSDRGETIRRWEELR